MDFTQRYNIINEEILGQGAYSKVFKGIDNCTQNQVAVKSIETSKLCLQDQMNIQNEIQILKSLQHSNIISLEDHYQDKTQTYMILELGDNGNLFNFIPSDGLSELLALKIFYQTIKAVQYLHRKGIIHRDIKPENIFLDKEFNVKLGDFGWAKKINDQNKLSICGTLEYMSPEVISNQFHDEKTDIWCLGILLFEMLSGNPPFNSKMRNNVKQKIIKGIYEVPQKISQFSSFLIQQMLKKDPKQRPSIYQIKQAVFEKIKKNFLIKMKDKELLIQYFLTLNQSLKNTYIPFSVKEYLYKQKNKRRSLFNSEQFKNNRNKFNFHKKKFPDEINAHQSQILQSPIKNNSFLITSMDYSKRFQMNQQKDYDLSYNLENSNFSECKNFHKKSFIKVQVVGNLSQMSDTKQSCQSTKNIFHQKKRQNRFIIEEQKLENHLLTKQDNLLQQTPLESLRVSETMDSSKIDIDCQKSTLQKQNSTFLQLSQRKFSKHIRSLKSLKNQIFKFNQFSLKLLIKFFIFLKKRLLKRVNTISNIIYILIL